MTDDTQGLTTPFTAHQRMLHERLKFFLDTLQTEVRNDAIRALEEAGKLLSPPSTNISASTLPAGVWSLLTLLIAQHISPTISPLYVSSVAVAVEFFICALDLLDDIEDDDQTLIVQALGSARVLNVSTTLLMLTQRAILSLSQQGIYSSHILRLLNTLQESALIATAGQHRDLLAEQKSAQDVTRDECIEIAAGKAGSLMRLACRLGALCAHADGEALEQFSELGELLGIAHQLDNDSHDLYHLLQDEFSAALSAEAVFLTRSVKTDLARGKKTLPVVLAARSEYALLQKMALLTDEEKREIHLRTLYEGITATWGICLLYRERARDHLQKIEARQPISPALRLLLGFT